MSLPFADVADFVAMYDRWRELEGLLSDARCWHDCSMGLPTSWAFSISSANKNGFHIKKKSF